MAATFTNRASMVPSQIHTNTVPGWCQDDIVEVTAGTGDYLAGGYAFGSAQLATLYGGAFSTLISVEVADDWRTAAGGGVIAFLAVWDAINFKVQAYGPSASVATGFTEVANANANLNGLRCSLKIRFN